jgi:hypothetical protein
MAEIETDYLVIGAGASGMAFTDALVDHDPEADVVLVDRRHRPGGHWLDAYPFVRLHQPSANYGVASRTLGHDRVDQAGPNAGCYERASADEICDYFARVLDEQFLPSGRVRFLGMSEHRGTTERASATHRIVSLVHGGETTVHVRRKVVDATYVESVIPSRHTPSFVIGDGVHVVPPNDLVDLADPPGRFVVLGAGKTGMDTCNWLLDQGVDPGRIRWVRGRDPWLFDRGHMQPLDLVASYMELQAAWVAAAAEAEDGRHFAHLLEDAGVFVRIDPNVEPLAFRGAIISPREVDALRTIDDVVRARRVLAIEPHEVHTEHGTFAAEPGDLYVDCTAPGVRPVAASPLFEPGRITIQYVTIGIVPYSGATIGRVEALDVDDARKNELCPPSPFSGDIDDVLEQAYRGMSGTMARGSDPEVAAWNNACRLNPAQAAPAHADDPRVLAALGSMGTHIGAAMANLARHAAVAPG